MQQDVWMKTGLVLYEEEAITIEAANRTVTRMLGALKNVPFNISGPTFYLQVQIVRKAPYEVL
jgi:hypothetical protein